MYSTILLAYLQVAVCVGINHPNPRPPTVTYLPVKHIRCGKSSPTGKCCGLYYGPPGWPYRKIQIAGGCDSIGLLQHEMVHDLLRQRDGDPDGKHKDPAFHECVTGSLDEE